MTMFTKHDDRTPSRESTLPFAVVYGLGLFWLVATVVHLAAG